ncbi:hypothetical protein GW17_00039971 [Ensete ventricosum]|nr:hypothetical protein GW17_00039971 [Ensete ventricosum]
MADTELGCPATPELLLHVHGARSIPALRSAPLTASIRRRPLSSSIPSSCPTQYSRGPHAPRAGKVMFAHYLSPVAPNGVARIDLEIDACGLEVLVPPIAASRTPPPPCVCFRSPPPAAPPLLRPS